MRALAAAWLASAVAALAVLAPPAPTALAALGPAVAVAALDGRAGEVVRDKPPLPPPPPAPPPGPPPLLPTPPLPLTTPPARPFAPPPPRTTILANGLRLVFVPDHSTPSVRGILLMRGGLRGAPADKLGVATLAAAVQRSGGSLAHPGSAFDAALDDAAASVEAGAAPDATSLGFECLAPDAGRVLGLVGELVTSPALPADRLALAQAQAVNALVHRDDGVSGIPARELAKLIYGKDSVHARSATVPQVRAVTRDDLSAYLATWQRPDAAVLALVGDLSQDGAVAVATAALGGWAPAPGAPAAPPALPSTPLADPAAYAGKLFLIDRPGLTQASIALGEPGVALADPDAPALDLLAGALNSFGGRLFDGLRSRGGLAYTVAAAWDTGRVDHAGLFVAGGASARPAEFVARLQAALEAARADPPAGAELEAAKAEALESFVFNYSTPDAAASRGAAFALLGLPPDYLATYRKALEGVGAGDVARAAAAHLHPADAAVVVVADARSVRAGLAGLGRPVVDLVVEPVGGVGVAGGAGGGGGGGGGLPLPAPASPTSPTAPAAPAA